MIAAFRVALADVELNQGSINGALLHASFFFFKTRLGGESGAFASLATAADYWYLE